jgi:hypothetical protein
MKKVLLLTLICFVALSGYCLAKDCNIDTCHEAGIIPSGKWWQISDVAKDLNLTAEEQKQLDDLDLENRRKMVDLHSQVEKERMELEKLFDAETLNEAECLNQFKKIQNTREYTAAEKFSFILNVRKLMGKDRFQRLRTTFKKPCAKQCNKNGKMRKAD